MTYTGKGEKINGVISHKLLEYDHSQQPLKSTLNGCGVARDEPKYDFLRKCV